MESLPILIVASNFPPVQSAGVYRTLRLAKYLPERGWKPHVLTLSVDTLPKGTLVDEGLLSRIPDVVTVLRANARFPIEQLNRTLGRDAKRATKQQRQSSYKPNANSQSSTRKNNHVGVIQKLKDRITLPWMTPDRLVGWIGPASRMGISAAKKSDFQVIYSSGPPWSNHLVAGKIATATRLPWVADFRDPWVGNAFRPGRNDDSWAGRKHRNLEASVFEHADVVIFNTPRSRDDATARAGDMLAAKSVVIPNGFDPANYCLDSIHVAQGSASNAPLTLVHPGAFYGKRNVDSLFLALANLTRRGELTEQDFQVKLIGADRPGRTHEKDQIDELNLNRVVQLTPPVPHAECLTQLTAADVLLLVQTDAPLCVPGKLYEYIAIGKPVLTISSEGSTADLVGAENLGPCVAPDDIDRLEAALRELLDRHRSGQLITPDPSVRQRYDGRNQMSQFDTAFRRAMANRTNSIAATGGTK